MTTELLTDTAPAPPDVHNVSGTFTVDGVPIPIDLAGTFPRLLDAGAKEYDGLREWGAR